MRNERGELVQVSTEQFERGEEEFTAMISDLRMRENLGKFNKRTLEDIAAQLNRSYAEKGEREPDLWPESKEKCVRTPAEMYRYASKINLIKLHKLYDKSERMYDHFGKTIEHSTFK